MKHLFETVIRNGDFALGEMLRRIDSYHISGKLSDEDRTYLYSLARGSADPAAGTDIYAKLAELEERVRALESAQTGTEDGNGVASEYVPGKWYRAGDKVAFNGKTYTCIAPEGQVCTWSPDEYPAYWQEE